MFASELFECNARSESKLLYLFNARFFLRGVDAERKCWDPKGGELCLGRVKAGETLLEARSNTDVQIVCQI